MERLEKEQRLRQVQAEAAELERELAQSTASEWPPKGHYYTYYAMTGAFLGLLGASASLLLNIVGALIVAPPEPLTPHPLNLIRVYLTFPLGDAALSMDAGVALAFGCCLYLGTGMLLGIPFQVIQSLLPTSSTFKSRLAVGTIVALLIWLLNFGILAWLQPLLFNGNWIVTLIPWWVAALTHLSFGWTMVLVYPLGTFTPYRLTES